MGGKKIKKIVSLDEELAFLKRLQGAGDLVNMVLKQTFGGCRTEGERVVRAMKILDGRLRLRITLGDEGPAEGPDKVREKREEAGKAGGDSGKKTDRKKILAELAEAAKEFEA